MPVTDWNWREVKGRRSKRRPHPQLNDSSEDEEEQKNQSPEQCSPAVASQPSRPKALAPAMRSESLIWLWRTREFFFQKPPQWEILVENTFMTVRGCQYRSSRTVSAPARLITSGGSTSSTARPPPRLPANFPAAPTGSPPPPPEKVPALVLAAAPEPDAPTINQDVLGCMTLVKKRRGRNKLPDEICSKLQSPQSTYGTSLLQRALDFQPESSRDSAGAALTREEEDETLSVDDAEEESTNDGMRPGSEDTLHTNDASTTLTKSEFAEDPNSPPVSHYGDSKPSEASAEEDVDQASAAASPGSQSGKARRRARKRAAKAAARASEAACNPQDVDAPHPKPAASKKSKAAAAAVPQMSPLVTAVLSQCAATASALRLSRETYSDQGSARTSWPSRRPVRDHVRLNRQEEVPWLLEAATPSCGSSLPTQRPTELLAEEELPELEPNESAARLVQLKKRLADVQLNLQKARKDVKEQEFRNMPTDHRILREMESAVRHAEMAVLREEEDLEKERRKLKAKPLAKIPSSPMAASEFSIRDGMRSRAAEEASPCGDSSDAVALVSRTLARERALAGLAGGGENPELQAMVERGLPPSRPHQAVDTATLSRSLLASR